MPPREEENLELLDYIGIGDVKVMLEHGYWDEPSKLERTMRDGAEESQRWDAHSSGHTPGLLRRPSGPTACRGQQWHCRSPTQRSLRVLRDSGGGAGEAGEAGDTYFRWCRRTLTGGMRVRHLGQAGRSWDPRGNWHTAGSLGETWVWTGARGCRRGGSGQGAEGEEGCCCWCSTTWRRAEKTTKRARTAWRTSRTAARAAGPAREGEDVEITCGRDALGPNRDTQREARRRPCAGGFSRSES